MNEAKIITKEYAKATGRKFYFTGIPCKKAGHIGDRYTRSGYCRDCENVRLRERKNGGVKLEKVQPPVGYISLAEAVAKKLRYYFTGLPCNKRGHVCPRYTCSGVCVECAKEYVESRRAANEAKREDERAWKKEEKIIPGARRIKGRCQSGSL